LWEATVKSESSDRWRQIQRAFPNEIKEKVEGKTAERFEQQIKEEKANAVAVCKQGEIQKEYEMMLAREQERLRAEREQEEQESLQYIQRVIVSDFFWIYNDIEMVSETSLW